MLAIFLGVFGIQRFYIGQSGTGTAMLLISILSCGIAAPVIMIIGWFDALVMAGGGNYRTSSGEPVIWE